MWGSIYKAAIMIWFSNGWYHSSSPTLWKRTIWNPSKKLDFKWLDSSSQMYFGIEMLTDVLWPKYQTEKVQYNTQPIKVRYSGDLNSGNIWKANFYFIFQMVCYSDAHVPWYRTYEWWAGIQMVVWVSTRPLTSWWSE